MATYEENQKKWAQLVARAWMDESFKQELLSDPKQVFKDNGMTFEKDCDFRIVEAKRDEFCFILPAKPEGNLSETELKNIAAAGGTICSSSGPDCSHG